MKTLPITHSVLHAKALGERIKDHYGLAEPFRCELLTRGMNDVYLVRSAMWPSAGPGSIGSRSPCAATSPRRRFSDG